jgi:flagellar motor switch protein FliN/FliY
MSQDQPNQDQEQPVEPGAQGANPAAGGSSSAESMAADALKAAQAAIASLKGGATPAPSSPASASTAADDSAAAALRAAQAAISQARTLNQPSPPDVAPAAPSMGSMHGATGPLPPGSTPSPLSMPVFGVSEAKERPAGLDLLSDVNLDVKVELGRTRMFVEDILRLGGGSVVELDKLAGDPVDIYVNDRHVARGEVLVLNDNFCVRINEITMDKPE